MAEGRPGPGRQLRAIGPLPAMTTIVIPAVICLLWGANPGWGLPVVLAAAAVASGAALIVLGLRLMGQTIALFTRVGEGTLAPWDPTRRLVAIGPYRRVRNPMITGVFTVLSGETLILGEPAMIAWTAIFGTLNAIFIPLWEEPGLVKRFGDDYVRYRDNVPRWIPRRTPWTPTFVLALALAAFVLAPSAQAGAVASAHAGAVASAQAGARASAQAGAVTARELGRSPAQVREFWTPERMRAAESLDPPAAPEHGGEAAAAAITPYAQAPDQETDPALDTSYPQRLHGILFLRFGSQLASCSATVVTSRNRSVILTAGHCVVTPAVEGASGPVWAQDLLFVPGYRNGAAPLGSYAGATGFAPFGWVVSGDLSLDVASVMLAPLNGVAVEDALGSRGVSFNRPAGTYKKGKTRFQIFGYPAEPSAFYDGERLIRCDSAFTGFQRLFSSPLAACNMKEGSSGGGWVLSGGLVNSVVSHNPCGTSPTCPTIAGTYFGDSAFKLWSNAGGGIGKGRQKKIKACKRKPKQKRGKCLLKAQKFKPLVR